MFRFFQYSIVLLALISCSQEPSPPLSTSDALKLFQVASGFDIELVASEPMVQDPVVIQFDQNGKLWVVEMRGFMPDIDGNGEENPTGRVIILTDQDKDGTMDHRSVFADSLVLPRSLAIVNSGALIVENQILWYMEDTDGDNKSDVKILVDSTYGKKGVIEHSPNGLWRGTDNWYYNAKSDYRYRFDGEKWIKQKTEFRGQWGISHDNFGRLYYNYNWSQLHADLVPPNYLSANANHIATSGIDHAVSQDRRIFPIRENLAVNRGYIPGTLDQNARLIEFASACAPYIYRGDLLDPEIVGDAFVCEPTGNLIKRNRIVQEGIYPVAQPAYDTHEFLASSDERFRPVWITSGPDGALYIADMYRGIIQHGPYMSPYLREMTLERQLDKHINYGRIWKIVPKDRSQPVTNPLITTSTTDLVTMLGHSNGWYRDMGQRLLIERKDPKAIELIVTMIQQSNDELAKLHGIWTLNGLGFRDSRVYIELLDSDQPRVRANALRVLEPLIIDNPELVDQVIKALPETGNEIFDLQLTLTSRVFSQPAKYTKLMETLGHYKHQQVFRDAAISSLHNQEYDFLHELLEHDEWQEFSQDNSIMIELLATTVARKKNPDELTELINQLADKPIDWQQKAIITGLSFHDNQSDSEPIRLKQEPKLFRRQEVAQQASELEKISELFAWPGKVTSKPVIDSVELADSKTLAIGRNLYLSTCSNCHGTDGKGLSRFGPPLTDSEWVLGSPERLVRILLHGMQGPIEVNGRTYDTPDILPVMPAFATTPANDLAAVMTYIRQEWGNRASIVEPGLVGGIRVKTQGKVIPWTAEELEEYRTSNKE